MGNYNGGTTHPRSASNAKANTALALASVGAGLGLANYNSGCGRNNGGLLSNILGGGNNDCYVDQKEYAWGQAYSAVLAELGMERSERYTDQTTLELYKEQVNSDKEIIAYVNALFERLGDKVDTKSEQAMAGIIANAKDIAANDKEIALNKRDSEWQYKLTQRDIKAGDDAERCFVEANYVKGNLVMPLDKICPEAMPKCPDVQQVQLVAAAQAFAQAMGGTVAKASAQ